MGKKLYIKTYGCQMNVYDSGRMEDVLAPLGFEPVDAPDDADMVILNTCHIREKAEDKLFSDLGRLRPLKAARTEAGDGMIVAVAGCVAQAEGAEILRRAPYVDIVLGPQTYHRLPEMVARAARANGGILETDYPAETKFDHLPDESRAPGISAFLSIQEGCDKFCTFCVVPYTRGAEYSRPAEKVLAEARRLVVAGARELTLLGQNVNAYHGEARASSTTDGSAWNLARLVRALAEIPELCRIRYTTSHPRDVDDELIRAHGEIDKLMPFLHLPVQSGSDRILEAMNRKHKAADYVRVIERFRAARPDLAFSSDFIVGFPGETDADFRATLELVETVGYASAFSFRYSPRPGTPAATMGRQVEEPVAQARLLELQALLETQQRRFNASMIGRTLPVLFEKPGRHPGQLIGRNPYLQGVHAAADASLMGTLRPVTIIGATLNSLAGELPPAPQRNQAA